MKRCYIVGAGENYGLDIRKEEGDLIIAADGGYRYLKEIGIEPDMVVGDFDTLKFIPDHPDVIELPTEKDVTDTWEAVSRAVDMGYREFHLLSCMGGRTEHSIANIQLLSHLAEKGMAGYLYDDGRLLTVIKDSEIHFNEGMKGFISIFSLSDQSFGVDIRNLKYELEDAELCNLFPLGVSNEFIGKQSSVSVRKGMLLIIFQYKECTDMPCSIIQKIKK